MIDLRVELEDPEGNVWEAAAPVISFTPTLSGEACRTSPWLDVHSDPENPNATITKFGWGPGDVRLHDAFVVALWGLGVGPYSRQLGGTLHLVEETEDRVEVEIVGGTVCERASMEAEQVCVAQASPIRISANGERFATMGSDLGEPGYGMDIVAGQLLCGDWTPP